MALLYYDDAFLLHDTGHRPENAGRLQAVMAELQTTGLLERCARPARRPASAAQLRDTHSESYLLTLQAFAEQGGGRIEVDTEVSPASYDVACLAAGAACDAVRRVIEREDQRALVLARPPGHHALADRAMGFCLVANVSVAARYAIDHLGLDRVLIVDWDVHHGNGTQAIFWEDERVGFFSIHRYPFYPGTGAKDETGTGAGLGATRNLPVAMGISRRDFLTHFGTELADFAHKIRPDLVLVSAGFDAHAEDPVGSLGLASEDFGELTQLVMQIADSYSHGRLISILEGGYHPRRLAESVGIHLTELLAPTRLSPK